MTSQSYELGFHKQKQVFEVEHDLTCPEPEGWSRTEWEVSQGWTPASDLWEQTFPHLKKTKWGFLGWKTNQFSLQSNVWQKNLIWKCHSPSVWSSGGGLAVVQRFLSGFFYSHPFCTQKSLIVKRHRDIIKSYSKWVLLASLFAFSLAICQQFSYT